MLAEKVKRCTGHKALGIAPHEVPVTEFTRHKSKKDGLQPQCKSCRREMHRMWNPRTNPQTNIESRIGGKYEDIALKGRIRRRLREQEARVDVGRYTRQSLYCRDNGHCHICQKPVKYTEYHVDHIMPIGRGGTDSVENVAIAHPVCNRAKHAYTMEELEQMGVLSRLRA